VQFLTGQKHTDPFLDCDWATLEEWCGTRTLARGRQYQRDGRVYDLSCSGDGLLVAWVEGTERYATAVMSDAGITSVCTCPVGSGCKHAVAVILEYLAICKANKFARILTADDMRLSLLGIKNRTMCPAEGPTLPGLSPVLAGGQDVQHSHKGSRGKPGSLHQYLLGLPKKDLVGLLDDLIYNYPEVEQDITDRKSIAAADATPILDVLLQDIDRITAEDAWSDSWNGKAQIPDYSPVEKRMEMLLSMGYPDAVVRAGRVLLTKGADQVEQSSDEGETADGIASCMEIVFAALGKSSLPAHERMLFAILAELDDNFDLCAGADLFWKEHFSERDWGLVANSLLSRLGESRYDTENGDYGSRYARDQFVGWIMTALDRAGQKDAATDLGIAEVERTASYVRLVRRLLRLGRGTDAREWIGRGIAATGTTHPGIAAELRTIQRDLWEREGEWLCVAGTLAGEFLSSPSFAAYARLEKAARKAGVWDNIKDAVMQYLMEGKFPQVERGRSGESEKLFGYLPDTGLTPATSWKVPGTPFFEILIDVAIAEKKPDDVIRWYDRCREQARMRGLYYCPHDKVADFVAEQFPDRSLEIWMANAERLISEGRPKSYETSIVYLKKIRALMKKQGMDDAWAGYLTQIRDGNARKKRFLEMLVVLSGNKILKS